MRAKPIKYDPLDRAHVLMAEILQDFKSGNFVPPVLASRPTSRPESKSKAKPKVESQSGSEPLQTSKKSKKSTTGSGSSPENATSTRIQGPANVNGTAATEGIASGRRDDKGRFRPRPIRITKTTGNSTRHPNGTHGVDIATRRVKKDLPCIRTSDKNTSSTARPVDGTRQSARLHNTSTVDETTSDDSPSPTFSSSSSLSDSESEYEVPKQSLMVTLRYGARKTPKIRFSLATDISAITPDQHNSVRPLKRSRRSKTYHGHGASSSAKDQVQDTVKPQKLPPHFTSEGSTPRRRPRISHGHSIHLHNYQPGQEFSDIEHMQSAEAGGRVTHPHSHHRSFTPESRSPSAPRTLLPKPANVVSYTRSIDSDRLPQGDLGPMFSRLPGPVKSWNDDERGLGTNHIPANELEPVVWISENENMAAAGFSTAPGPRPLRSNHAREGNVLPMEIPDSEDDSELSSPVWKSPVQPVKWREIQTVDPQTSALKSKKLDDADQWSVRPVWSGSSLHSTMDHIDDIESEPLAEPEVVRGCRVQTPPTPQDDEPISGTRLGLRSATKRKRSITFDSNETESDEEKGQRWRGKSVRSGRKGSQAKKRRRLDQES